MISISAPRTPEKRAVRWWLFSIALLIAIMVLVGGATRLTESGLSIVEWKPVTGALPRISWDGRQRSLRAMRVLLSGVTFAPVKPTRSHPTN